MKTKDILIIDDDQVFTRSIQAMLTEHKYRVEVANDAQSGMEKLNTRKPDLLILDVMMASDLEGQRLAHTLKRDPEYRDLPILVITGMMDRIGVNIRDAFEDVAALPSVTMLDKPFESAELLSRIEEMMALTGED